MVICFRVESFHVTLPQALRSGDIVHWFTPIPAVILVLLTATLVYGALRIWRGRARAEKLHAGVDFRPRIGFSRLDGFNSVAVLLTNKSPARVWTEEIEIVLTDLDANQQSSQASCHEIHKIRQTVGPDDMLPISL